MGEGAGRRICTAERAGGRKETGTGYSVLPL